MEIGKAKAEVAKIAKLKDIDVQSELDIFFFNEVLLMSTTKKFPKDLRFKVFWYNIGNIRGLTWIYYLK